MVFESPRDVARFTNIDLLAGRVLTSDNINTSVSVPMLLMLDSAADGIFVGVNDINTPFHV